MVLNQSERETITALQTILKKMTLGTEESKGMSTHILVRISRSGSEQYIYYLILAKYWQNTGKMLANYSQNEYLGQKLVLTW